MKVLKGFGTIIVLALLVAAFALTLLSGLIRFMAMNPSYVKSFMVTHKYCEEIRDRLSDDLDHISALYGIEEGELKKLDNPYCKSILSNDLPLTIGGGIGQSRLCMYFLNKSHIGEVQASVWTDEIIKETEEKGIYLL